MSAVYCRYSFDGKNIKTRNAPEIRLARYPPENPAFFKIRYPPTRLEPGFDGRIFGQSFNR
jgi:hypothetical protein